MIAPEDLPDDSLVIDIDSDNEVIEVKSYQEAQLKIARMFADNPKIKSTKITKFITERYYTATGYTNWHSKQVRIELERLGLRKTKPRKPKMVRNWEKLGD